MATFTITGGGATGYGANGPNVKVANVVINLTELSGLAATDTIEAIEVPAGTAVLAAGYEILTVGTGSGTLSLGDDGDVDRYVTAVVQTAAGQKAALATLVPHLYTAANTIDLKSATAVCNSKVRVWAIMADCNGTSDDMVVALTA